MTGNIINTGNRINDPTGYGTAYQTTSNSYTVTNDGNTTVHITNINEYTTIRVSSPGEPAGNSTEIQFNMNGQMDGDDGLTYNPTTDSLTVIGNLDAGAVLTDSLKYANGVDWNFGGTSYSNSNVQAYLPTYTGNLNVTNVVATLFAGSGANLTNIQGANVTGTVANATHATTADTANSVEGVNVTGTVSSATNATNATNATSASTATTAGTVTTAAQPNITSVGSLANLTVSSLTGVVDFTTTANVTLGNVSNLHISGGVTGQVLSTNGSGVLSWTTPGAANLQAVTTAGATTDQAVSITNTTASTNYATGALKVSGGLGVGEAIHAYEHITARTSLYAGQYADFSSWVVPKFIGRDAGATYIQGALINTNGNGSADWVAYNDTSPPDGSEGWADFGYTGSTFNDPLYTVTKANDGYFFVQGIDSIAGGNLVISTGELGDHHDIVFATGGFLEEQEVMRLDHERNTLFVGGHAHLVTTDRTINLDVNGNATFRSNLIVDTIAGNFTFGNDGLLTLSGGAIVDSSSDNFEVRGIENVNFEANSVVNIYTDGSGNAYQWIFDDSGKLSLPGNVYSSSYKNKIYSNYGVVLEPTYNGSGNAPALYVSYNDGISIMPVTNDYLNGGGQTSPLYIEGNYANSGTAEPGGVFIDGGYNSNTSTAGNVYFGTLRAGSVNIGKSGVNVNITGTTIVTGNILPSANVSYDLGSPTQRFNDLYLAGTTIDLGGTLIQAQANGEVSIGNATFSTNGTISASSITKAIRDLNTTSNVMSAGDTNSVVVNTSTTADFNISNADNLAVPEGTEVTLVAMNANIIIQPTAGAQGTGVYLYKVGNNIAQSTIMVPQPFGRATLLKMTANTWLVSGDIA